MDEETWEVVKEAIDEGQEWWISRVPEEKSFLLIRSLDRYTQYFKTAEELYQNGMIDGKPFIERIGEL